jgi:hypothetical protein
MQKPTNGMLPLFSGDQSVICSATFKSHGADTIIPVHEITIKYTERSKGEYIIELARMTSKILQVQECVPLRRKFRQEWSNVLTTWATNETFIVSFLASKDLKMRSLMVYTIVQHCCTPLCHKTCRLHPNLDVR